MYCIKAQDWYGLMKKEELDREFVQWEGLEMRIVYSKKQTKLATKRSMVWKFKIC